MHNLMMIVVVAVVVLGLMAIGPLALIWSLNTLFPVLAIPYTIWTWLAAMILAVILAPNVKVTKKG